MATGYIILPASGGVAPSGLTNNIAAEQINVDSSGAATAAYPKVRYTELNFDQTTDEHWLYPILLPANYASGGLVRLKWGAKVTSGNVIWKAGIMPAVDNSTDVDASVFNAGDLSSALAVPTVVGRIAAATTIALTMTGAAANQFIVIFIGRDADNASDTAAGDATVYVASFEYTTT